MKINKVDRKKIEYYLCIEYRNRIENIKSTILEEVGSTVLCFLMIYINKVPKIIFN